MFVHIQAKDRAGSLPDRLSLRPAHLERLERSHASGVLLWGAATLSEENEMNGSVALLSVADLAAAHRWVSEDPYRIGLVWEKITMNPVRAWRPREESGR